MFARLNTYLNLYRNCEAGTPHTASNVSNVVATYAKVYDLWHVCGDMVNSNNKKFDGQRSVL